MRFVKLCSVFACIMCFCACTERNTPACSPSVSENTAPVTAYIQEKEQLYFGGTPDIDAMKLDYTPINYDKPRGKWFPYMDYGEYMQGKSEKQFRNSLSGMYGKAKKDGINTIYVHVRPCGDAYYKSEIFPSGTYLDGDYDPLEIMLEEAHKLGLSVHGWINPLRCQTEEQLKNIMDDFTVKKWSKSKSGSYVNIVKGRYYLNPAYDEVIQLVCDGISEIVRNYDVDGIHIDDYFYPTTEESFDKSAFKASGSRSLSEWRLSNCSRLVHAMYESVKRVDGRLLFGISPQGNIDANYSSCYADVRLWGSCIGYCDYMIPQIYFGFENELCPFEKTLADWEEIVSCDSVSLIAGLAAYKQGAEDKWAGKNGELEWIENDDIIERQIKLTEISEAIGYALYE